MLKVRRVKFGWKMGANLLQVFLYKMADTTGNKMAASRAALNRHKGSAHVFKENHQGFS